MKVLFAVNNEHISDSIIKKYQQDYRELISSKNVYYFNALLKELQEDKSYDRIVIGEDLEMFSNNNYDVMDKFIFDKLDKISDEASNASGEDIPIVLICTDRRSKSDPILVKLFSIGIYSALLGQDRTITNVCKLINIPRTKKEAKIYYRIDSDDADYKSESENDVSEVEIQNILMHYKRLGKNEEKYVDSFNSIASQYTDAQLKVIAKFLPLNVKAVLEAECPKYQEIMMGGPAKVISAPQVKETKTKYKESVDKYKNQKTTTKFDNAKLDLVQKQLEKNKLTKPVVVPSAMNINRVTKIEQNPLFEDEELNNQGNIQNSQNVPNMQNGLNGMDNQTNIQNNIDSQMMPNNTLEDDDPLASIKEELKGMIESGEGTENTEQPVIQPKRGRGRPKKVQPQPVQAPNLSTQVSNDANASILPGFEDITEEVAQPKRGRGRPKKVQPQPVQTSNQTMEVGNNNLNNTTNATNDGYENIVTNNNIQPSVNLFDLDDDVEETNNSYSQESTSNNQMSNGTILPGIDDDDDETVNLPNQNYNMQNNNYMPNTQGNNSNSYNNDVYNQNNYNQNQNNYSQNGYNQNSQSLQYTQNSNVDFTRLFTSDKKAVAFVGTSKNGTSFLVNNLADLISQSGIKTAILDLTKNKNAYYIYTENEEELRKKAYSCIDNLRRGNPVGINVSKNLDVYTTLPGENGDINDAQNIMQTLVSNYSLVLLDCDFDTNVEYFRIVQEIYLVQTYDVLTIQPLTAFLRDLKSKNILDQAKLKIVLNKVLRVKSITDRTIIGGMAFYNDPAMSFMTELFNKDEVPYCVIPFEDQTYSKYLEGLVNCKITTNGYSKNFMLALSKLSSMVYPLISRDAGKKSTKPGLGSYKNTTTFNSSMNDTLNKMKNNF